jgi:hypothetical protein
MLQRQVGHLLHRCMGVMALKNVAAHGFPMAARQGRWYRFT